MVQCGKWEVFPQFKDELAKASQDGVLASGRAWIQTWGHPPQTPTFSTLPVNPPEFAGQVPSLPEKGVAHARFQGPWTEGSRLGPGLFSLPHSEDTVNQILPQEFVP